MEVAGTALPGDVLVDLGVRFGASSAAMLYATLDQKCRVIGVDPSPQQFGPRERYAYLQTDSISAVAGMPDDLFLVFFDTLHIKEQVMAELFYYWPKIRVGGWAIFHDTNWPEDKHDTYLDTVWEQPMAGIIAFFGETARTRGVNIRTKDFSFEHHLESWGMTFIQKLTDWNPIVPGMEAALEASRRLTKHVCGI